jgi:hypothetical protein
MAYSPPQNRIFQLVRTTPQSTARRALACLVGGHAKLFRYSNADEKLLIGLGSYDPVGSVIDGDWKTCYNWPNKPAGSDIDTSYTRVFVDNALLKYFEDVSHTMTKVTANTIRHPTKNFADNGAYLAAADFLDRGVKVGDIIKVKASYDDIDYELVTYVKGFKAEVVAASIGSAAAISGNQGTAGSTSSFATGAGNIGDADISSVSAASYSGYVNGNVSETYTVTVIQSSTGGDLTTALLRITSASGNDDVASQIPAASGYATAIGANGATATFDNNAGDMIFGDTWTVTVREAWTATVPTAGGTYTGTKNRQYIVEVVTGGISDGDPLTDPEIRAYAADGSDSSGPTPVPTSAGTAVAVGNYGATISFSTAKLRKGDRFEFTATAASAGAYKTLVLAHSLNDALPLADDAIDMEITLYIKENIELPKKNPNVVGDWNWTQSETEICILADAYYAHPDWTDDGDVVPLPLAYVSSAYGKLYVQYKAWLSDLSTAVGAISDPEDLDDLVSGPIDIDNPLKYGLSKALENNNGQLVYFISVPNPTVLGDWSTALEYLEDTDNAYGLVPLTYDTQVRSLFKAYVLAQSAPEVKKYKTVFFGVNPSNTTEIVSAATSEDLDTVLATTEDDPDTSGTQNTLLRITSGNANLLSLGVAAGDVVRIRYQTDAWGDETYEEYVVDDVVSEDYLKLASGTASPESVPIKIEIWRTLTGSSLCNHYVQQAGAVSNWRVRMVFQDNVGVDGVKIPNYFMCCSLAALAGGVFQHHGLTNFEVGGYSALPVSQKLTDTQRNILAEGGIWLVIANSQGKIFSRHAISTSTSGVLAEQEEVMLRNFDMICATFDEEWRDQIGISNATADKLSVIRVRFEAKKEELRVPITPDLGPYLVDATITDLRISAVFKDTIILAATLELPAPFNKFDAYFMI